MISKGEKKNKFILLAAAVLLSGKLTANAAGGETYISKTAYEACETYGAEYNICPELLEAIIERESSGIPDAENGGCKGLMQIYEKFHKNRMERLGVTDLYDERQNILVGADYLSELFSEYEDVSVVLSAYHGEKDGIRKAEKGILSGYVTGILERSAELEVLHGK